ncbi:hypothetical protein DIPPA_20768 [Diplonema papillatum]|nr:hypothetical protein DIPPA_20768 [Diplonema papillatum]
MAPPGGMHEDQRVRFSVSACLTLLDLRVAADGAEVRSGRRLPDEEGIAPHLHVRVRVPRHSLAGRFLAKAHGVLTGAFKALLGLRLGMYVADEDEVPGEKYPEPLLCATFAVDTPGDWPESAARDAVRVLEGKLEGEDDGYRWHELVANLVDECKAVLLALPACPAGQEPVAGQWDGGVRSNFDRSRVEAVEAQRIVPSGLPTMEYSFSAGGTQILYPDPTAFEPEHWRLWGQFSPYAASRGRLDYLYAAATWVPHEVLHCVQDGALGTVGAAAHSLALHNWQCEYCACFGQALLLAAVVAENRKKGANRKLMLPSHMLEESLLWLESVVRHQKQQRPAGTWAPEEMPPGVTDAVQPYDFHEHSFPPYMTLLGSVAVDTFQQYQTLVEQEEQTTSYWAELVKYVNVLLGTVSAENIPVVAAALPKLLEA